MGQINIKLIKIFLLVTTFFGLFFVSCRNEDDKRCSNEVIDVDFTSSMGTNFEGRYKKVESKLHKQEKFFSLKNLYEKHRPSIVEANDKEKIPLIIHQIWLGPSRLSKTCEEYRKNWQKLHPDWKYYFWNDKAVERFDFELKKLYEKAETWDEKEEILRAELLDCFGGLCVGVDFQPLSSFEQLHHKYDFYTGILPPTDAGKRASSPLVVSSSLVASTPSHPIIKEWKNELSTERKIKKLEKKEMQTHYTCRSDSVFERAVLNKLDDKGFCNIVFPATYFYPLDSMQVSESKITVVKRQIHKFLQVLNIKKQVPFSKIMPESLTVHHWARMLKTQEEHMHDVTLDLLRLQKELVKEVKELKEQLQSLEKSKVATE